MEPYTVFPNQEITKKGIVSDMFLRLRINSFWDACQYVHDLPYGYNASREIDVLFTEGYGSCTTKHAVIATLAEEHTLPLSKMMGVYEMDESLVTGADPVLKKYGLPYIPMVHCFLSYTTHSVDLTEGNSNGKNHPNVPYEKNIF